MDAFVLGLFLHMWSAKHPQPPNLSPIADVVITWGGIQGLGYPFYICGLVSSLLVSQLGPVHPGLQTHK